METKKKLNFKENESIELKFEVLFELPFWVNLRTGQYKIMHKNLLKNLIDGNELELISHTGDYVDYIITVDNLMWKIGFDDFKSLEDENKRTLIVGEDLKSKRIISTSLLDEFFGDKKGEVFYNKLKTVISKRYVFPITFKREKELTLKELINPFIEPLKYDLLKAINEFLEIYLGYFSTEVFCNDVYLLGNSAFCQDRVSIKIILDDNDITSDVGFPMGLYSHPYYPTVFPKKAKEKLFFDLLEEKKYPSFTKILKGFSHNFFLHGDIKIGIICLDIALESCLSNFIEYYNSKQEDSSTKLKKLKKNHTLGDFLREDLKKILDDLFRMKEDEYISNILKFHEERNLIIHNKKRKIHPDMIKFRISVNDLIQRLENYMELPIVIKNIETDFDKLILGIAIEDFEKGWGQMRLFRSFSEMVLYQEEQKDRGD